MHCNCLYVMRSQQDRGEWSEHQLHTASHQFDSHCVGHFDLSVMDILLSLPSRGVPLMLTLS